MITLPETYVSKRPASELFLGENSMSGGSVEDGLSNKTIQKISLPVEPGLITADTEKEGEYKTFNNAHKDDTKDDFYSQEGKRGAEAFAEIKIQKYSNAYITYEVTYLIESIIEDFKAWKARGTSDSYSEISNIKNLLEKYSAYLEERDETRILLGILEILFENNNWQDMNDTKLNLIINELGRFKDGDVSFASLESFSKQLWLGKVITE